MVYQFDQPMEGKKQALMLWIAAVTSSRVDQITDLRDGRLLEQLLSKIQGFSEQTEAGDLSDWKLNYNKLKVIYEQVNSTLQRNSKMALPEDLSYMNLIEMSQGKSEEGLETLLHLIFIVCIQSSLQSDFIPCIMQLPNSAQKELMMIIQESTNNMEEEDERDGQISSYKQAIAKLEFGYNTLVTENQALRASLFEDDERVRKNEEVMMKLKNQNQNLSRELFQKNQMLIRSREELMLDKYGTVNEELVEELKKELLEREQSNGQQIVDLKETISNLKEEIGHTRKSNLQLLEEQSGRNLMQGKMDHSNCIPIEKHKAKINEMLAMSKEATQKEMAAKLENIKVKNANAELENKQKRLNEELHKKNAEFMVTKDDASLLKVEFFTRIRDHLRTKLEEFNPKSEANADNCAEFLQNDAI